MKKTGEFLRKAREEKGLSVHEIGLSLKINPKILKQIEEGDRDNLPAKTFLRGFVQSYALFLKIDPNEVLRIFSDEMGTTKPHQISLTSGPQIKGASLDIDDPENKDDLGIKRHTGQNFGKEKFEFKNIGIGIVVFVLLLSLIAVRKVVEKYQREAEVDLAKAEENLKSSKLELPQVPQPSTPIPANEIKTSASSTGLPPAPGPQELKLPTEVPKAKNPPSIGNDLSKVNAKIPPAIPSGTTANGINQQPRPLATTLNKAPILPTAINSPVIKNTASTALTSTKPAVPVVTTDDAKTPPSTTKKPTTDDLKLATKPAPPKEDTKKARNIELVIEAFESVEIEMTQSTGKIEKIKMSPSQIQTIKTMSGVKLNISNGGAVNLSVNGKDIGVPGDLGKPKRVSF